jgi:hypothetical protein
MILGVVEAWLYADLGGKPLDSNHLFNLKQL